MKDATLVAFDDYIVGTESRYTGILEGRVLERADQLALHAVVDDVKFGRGLSLTVAIEHSSSGAPERWQRKNESPEIFRRPLVAGETTSLYGGEQIPVRPRHRHVRLRIRLVGGDKRQTPSAHVVVHVAGRIRTSRDPRTPDKPASEHGNSELALRELRGLVTMTSGLGPDERRDLVLASATPETRAVIMAAAAKMTSLDRNTADRLRSLATRVLAVLDNQCCADGTCVCDGMKK